MTFINLARGRFPFPSSEHSPQRRLTPMATTSKSLGGAMGGGCLLVCALFWSAITLSFDSFIAWASLRQIQALSYPIVTGTITSSEVESSTDSDGTTYRPLIKYTYVVDDTRYDGNRYRYGQMGTNDRSAERIVALFPVGKQVAVHHSPSNPAEAVLRVGLEGTDLYSMMFMLPFNLIMLAMWLALLAGARSRQLRPVAGGTQMIDDGRFLRLRLSALRPLYMGAAVAGGLAFALTFLVGFGFGVNAPIPVMCVAWGVILGGGGIAALNCHRKLARGDSDLLIDEFRGTVTLPRTCGRREEVVVPWEKIIALDVERIETRNSDDEIQRDFVPTIVFTADDGSQRRDKLIEWKDEASAEGLVEWLRERLKVQPSSEAGDDGEEGAEDRA